MKVKFNGVWKDLVLTEPVRRKPFFFSQGNSSTQYAGTRSFARSLDCGITLYGFDQALTFPKDIPYGIRLRPNNSMGLGVLGSHSLFPSSYIPFLDCVDYLYQLDSKFEYLLLDYEGVDLSVSLQEIQSVLSLVHSTFPSLQVYISPMGWSGENVVKIKEIDPLAIPIGWFRMYGPDRTSLDMGWQMAISSFVGGMFSPQLVVNEMAIPNTQLCEIVEIGKVLGTKGNIFLWGADRPCVQNVQTIETLQPLFTSFSFEDNSLPKLFLPMGMYPDDKERRIERFLCHLILLSGFKPVFATPGTATFFSTGKLEELVTPDKLDYLKRTISWFFDEGSTNHINATMYRNRIIEIFNLSPVNF
jgi:hypothetical protein